MQRSSSAFMRVADSQACLRECELMTPAEKIRAWMNTALEQTGWTIKHWAKEARVAPSTIHRALDPSYMFTTSTKTLNKLASAAGVTPPDVASGDPQRAEATFLPVRYDVGAGIWQEVTDAQVFIGTGPVTPDPAYAGFPQWLERIQGDSMDREYRDQDLIHVVDAIAIGYAPKHGDHVVLVRARMNGSEMERTVKEVVRAARRFEFWPRSTNPRWNKPVSFTDGVDDSDPNVEVEIAALVLGSYRPRRG